MTDQRRRALWVLVGVGAAILVVAVATSVVVSAVNSTLIRQQQVTNTKTLDSSERTLRLIRDCTRPSGECYARGEARVGGAVRDLSKVTVLAAACAASLDGVALTVPARATRIEECVMAELGNS